MTRVVDTFLCAHLHRRQAWIYGTFLFPLSLSLSTFTDFSWAVLFFSWEYWKLMCRISTWGNLFFFFLSLSLSLSIF